MSRFSKFMRENKVEKKNGFYAPTKSLCDENGKPLEWEFRHIKKMIVASVVLPDLYDAELQDSYGVSTPEELLLAMVDEPGEYNELAAFVQKFQGFDTSFDDKVEQAKN